MSFIFLKSRGAPSKFFSGVIFVFTLLLLEDYTKISRKDNLSELIEKLAKYTQSILNENTDNARLNSDTVFCEKYILFHGSATQNSIPQAMPITKNLRKKEPFYQGGVWKKFSWCNSVYGLRITHGFRTGRR